LTSISVDAVNPNYSSAEGVLFNKLKTSLIQCPGAKVGSYTIPDSVTTIGESVFESCSGLTSVTIPNSVTSIGGYAFYSCTNLNSAIFMGNSPTMGSSVFASTASGFTVYYFNGATGFTSPTWMGYPAVNMGAASPFAPWLLSNGFAYNANILTDPNSDGVNLLMAYALNLNPKSNLAGSMPRPVCAANQMSLTFYAGSEGVTYKVEASIDLQNWSTTGVALSAPDSNNLRTATVDLNNPSRFMRLVVSH
jgi:hypothetical protein